MTQCAIELSEFGGYSEIMVGDTTIQFASGIAEDTHGGILQTWREAVSVGTLIEIIHDTVKFGTRTVERGKALYRRVIHHDKRTAIGHRHIVIATQIVVTQFKTVTISRFDQRSPPTSTLPSVGSMKPSIRRNSVVLPMPVSPMMAVFVPALKSCVKWLSISLSPAA